MNFATTPVINVVSGVTSLVIPTNAPPVIPGDADVTAILSNVGAAGATISEIQSVAINTFVETGKTDSWYSKLLRLYVPIWGSATPNAVDWITGTSGTFVGSVTHGASFAKGAAGAYFDTGVTPADLGITTTSGGMGFFRKSNGSGTYPIGCIDTGKNFNFVTYGSTTFDFTNQSGGRVIYAGIDTGIISGNVLGTSIRLKIRKTAGVNGVSGTVGSLGTLPTRNIYFCGCNNAGGSVIADNSENGLMFINSGLTDAEDLSLTLALKTLWETCTGLTLP